MPLCKIMEKVNPMADFCRTSQRSPGYIVLVTIIELATYKQCVLPSRIFENLMPDKALILTNAAV